MTYVQTNTTVVKTVTAVTAGPVPTTCTQITTTRSTGTSSSLQNVIVPSSQANLVIIGNQQTDITLNPYIKPRRISFYARNLRPGVKAHIFIDSVNINEYCAPGVLTVDESVIVSSYSNTVVHTAPMGTDIYVDSNGCCAGVIYLQESMFKSGDRIIEISDSETITYGNSQITMLGTSIFTRNYLSVTNTYPTPMTINPHFAVLPLTNAVSIGLSSDIDVTTWGANASYVSNNANFTTAFIDPFAQVFQVVAPHGEAGIFITKIDVYFYAKSLVPGNGCSMYLCETNPTQGSGALNADHIPDTTVILPYSICHLTNDKIYAHPRGLLKTTFTFQTPIYVLHGKHYAFVIRPDGGDSGFHLFTTVTGTQQISDTYSPPNGLARFVSQPVTTLRIGEAAIPLPAQIYGAWIGSTACRWSRLVSEYFRFTIYRAEFSRATGTAAFVNDKHEFLTILNFTWFNDTKILPGDYVYFAANSFANATITTCNTAIRGIVTYHDHVKGVLYLNESTGNWIANCFIQVHRFPSHSTIDTCNSATIISCGYTYPFYTPSVHGMVGQFSAITPPGTNINYTYRGVSDTFVVDTNHRAINPGIECMFEDQHRYVYGHSTEVARGIDYSMVLFAQLVSDSSAHSPAIDLTKCSPVVIRNNCDKICSVYEEFFTTSTSRSRYVSNLITLAEGQDSEDLKITVAAHRPPGTDFQVWVRFLHALDSDPISMKNWTPMRNLHVSNYCNQNDPDDFQNFSFAIPYQYPMLPTSGVITCNATSNVITGANTLFGTECLTGWYINVVGANTSYNESHRRIVSITNTSSIILDAPFSVAYTGVPYYIVPPPGVAYMSANNVYAMSGVVQTINNTLVGTGTNFTQVLSPGSSVQINGYIQTVVSVANDTFITVGSTWPAVSNNVSNLVMYNVVPAGVTYLNSSLAYFSTFRSYQVKIVLQSNLPYIAPRISTVTATSILL